MRRDRRIALPRPDFNGIGGGSIGLAATTGCDIVTGLGTPRANLVVAGLVADAATS